MDEFEKEIAERVYRAIQRSSNESVRSLQSRDFKAGVSDLGYCSERVRRMLDGQVPEDTDVLAAFAGTALGDHIEQAILLEYPNAIIQAEVEVVLHGDGHTYRLPGHPDVILPDEGILLDVKTAFGLAMAERNGPSQNQQFQRHSYALGAWEAGLFAQSLPLEDVRVANLWMDRSAVDKRLHVDMEPFDPEQVRAAGEWLDEVVYNFLHGEESRKEPPRDVCAVTCGFYETCRLYDTDVEGLIKDPLHLDAVALYREGADMEKTGKRLKDEAKQALSGVSGSTGDFLVRWTRINESEVPGFVRRGYDKLEVRKMPKRKS